VQGKYNNDGQKLRAEVDLVHLSLIVHFWTSTFDSKEQMDIGCKVKDSFSKMDSHQASTRAIIPISVGIGISCTGTVQVPGTAVLVLLQYYTVVQIPVPVQYLYSTVLYKSKMICSYEFRFD
jgi:hypothetical protein